VGTAYDAEMNDRLRDYLAECGFEVSGMVGMNLRKVADAMAVADEAIMHLAQSALEAAGHAEAVLISCGAFATAHLIAELQKRYGRPVVSTTPATIAAALSAIAP
jgi:maleate cis-trans isomerase